MEAISPSFARACATQFLRKGEMKNTRVARNTAKLSACGAMKDLAERTEAPREGKIQIRRGFSVLRVSKVFPAACRNFLRRIRSCLLKAAKGAIIFHFRYRASCRRSLSLSFARGKREQRRPCRLGSEKSLAIINSTRKSAVPSLLPLPSRLSSRVLSARR